MTGKTHFMVGAATAVTVAQPQKVSDFALLTVVGGLFGMWADCDEKKSKISQMSNKAIVVCTIALVLIVGTQKIDIYHPSNMVNFFLGLCVIAGVTYAGRLRPHREATHSLLAVVLLGVIGYMLLPKYPYAGLIASLSHIVIDLPNKKGITLFFPIKKRISFNICKSDGIVSTVLLAIATLMMLRGFILVF